MALFDFLKRKPPTTPMRDLVWGTQAAKFAGACQWIDQHPGTVVLAWSGLTRDQFVAYAAQHMSQPPKVALMGVTMPGRLAGERLLLLEHHLYAQEETDFLQQAQAAEVVCVNSLDDPLLQLVGGERLRNLVQSMGMQPDELIEHRLIQASIRQAQQKMSQKRGESLPPTLDAWWRGLR
jgi:hypothetical protein